MKPKKIITILLLSFVVISIFTLIKNETKSSDDNNINQQVENQTIVYYFHGNKRCATCNKIENYTKEVIFNVYEKQINNNSIEFKIVNVEQSENEHFISDFSLTAKTVVLEKIVDGNRGEFKNLTEVWDLVGDKEKFQQYIQNETKSFLDGNS